MLSKNIGVLAGLLPVVIPLVVIARRLGISYPIVLVVGGVVLGFIPGLPSIQLDPNVVLVVFLPPLLYWQAITAPTDVMLANAGQISLLAIGLVVATTAAVAAVAHAIIPQMPWPVAFVLGAVISPTDELAAVTVLKSFRLPRHVMAIIEGESLFNDATALVIYAAAITAASSSVFELGPTLLHFIASTLASILIGYLASRLAVALWRRIPDPELQGTISLMLPFLAYLPAQYAGFSGVLAVVTAGVYTNRFTPRVLTPLARTQLSGFWQTLAFVSNALLFLIVGFQLHDVASATFQQNSWPFVAGSAIVINAVVVAVRLVLVLVAEYAPTAAPADHAAPNWRNALVVGWSGLRGSVSLAAALAIPATLANGTSFPHRAIIIFLTFTVIIFTLLVGGSTLPWLVHRLRIEGGTEERDEFRRARARSAEAALVRIDELEAQGVIDAAHAAAMRRAFEHRRDIDVDTEESAMLEHLSRDAEARRAIIAAQRAVILEMRDRGEIDNVVLRKLQAELDLVTLHR